MIYTINYWSNGQYNYDLTVEADNITEAVEKAPAVLTAAGKLSAVENNYWEVLYND
jgi:hypothetical protein